MNIHKSGSAVTTTFSLAAGAGVLAPTLLRSQVTDENGLVLSPWEDQPVIPGASEVLVPTVGALNTLQPPQLRGIRVVELEVTTADSVELLQVAHQLETAQLLVPGINSFQTYFKAVLEAQLYTDETMSGWAAQPDPAIRTRALMESFERICALNICIDWDDNQSVIRDRFFDPPRLKDLTAEQILRLEPRMLKALGKAQVVEANSLLTDDPVRTWRKQGIQSMTVGESSQYFGANRPLDNGGVDGETARILARWIRKGGRLGRA